MPAPWGLHSLHAWEQWALPRAARGALLLNLSGSAPWLGARTSVAMLHDAAVFEHPQAYTAAFVAWYRLLFRRLAQASLQEQRRREAADTVDFETYRQQYLAVEGLRP